MLKKLISLGVVAGVASLAVLDANPATAASLSFQFYHNTWNSSTPYGYGNFGGADNDADGFLRLDELTSFYSNITREGREVYLDDLFGFGSFDLNAAAWNPDGSGWGMPTGSYFSWNGGGNSVNFAWATVAHDYQPSPQTPVDVPEPGTVAALALMGASGLLTKRKLSKCSA